MGRGDRAKIRWAHDRVRKAKARAARKRTERQAAAKRK